MALLLQVSLVAADPLLPVSMEISPRRTGVEEGEAGVEMMVKHSRNKNCPASATNANMKIVQINALGGEAHAMNDAGVAYDLKTDDLSDLLK